MPRRNHPEKRNPTKTQKIRMRKRAAAQEEEEDEYGF